MEQLGQVGGVVIDLMGRAFIDAFLTYAALFAIVVGLLFVAFTRTTQMDIKASQARMEVEAVLE